MLRNVLEQGRRGRHKFNDVRAVTIFTAVLALFTVVLALVAAFQAWLMYTGGKDTHALAVAAKQQSDAAQKLAIQASKQVDAMQSQNKKLQQSLEETQSLVAVEKSQAVSTRELAAASHQSASAAIGALGLAQQSDRAWLSIVLFSPKPAIGEWKNVRGVISNVGHTPAYVDAVNLEDGNGVLMSEYPTYPDGTGSIESRSTLFPGQSETIPLKSLNPVTFGVYNKVSLGAENFYVFARVQYRSAGDPRKHSTHACIEWSKDYKSWFNCHVYNSAN